MDYPIGLWSIRKCSPRPFIGCRHAIFPGYVGTSCFMHLDRIEHVCPVCHLPSNIVSVWVNLTYVFLEARCPECGKHASRKFDLLEIDRWLQDGA
jgi:hypothetical protein